MTFWLPATAQALPVKFHLPLIELAQGQPYYRCCSVLTGINGLVAPIKRLSLRWCRSLCTGSSLVSRDTHPTVGCMTDDKKIYPDIAGLHWPHLSNDQVINKE